MINKIILSEMISTYKKLVLDPRCLKPSYEVNERSVYTDALDALAAALAEPNITISERSVLETTKVEIRKNRFAIK